MYRPFDVRCKHSEAWLDYIDDDGNVVHKPYPLHDCAYVDARNELIPEAERLAAEEMTTGNDAELSWRFHRIMNELSKELL